LFRGICIRRLYGRKNKSKQISCISSHLENESVRRNQWGCGKPAGRNVDEGDAGQNVSGVAEVGDSSNGDAGDFGDGV